MEEKWYVRTNDGTIGKCWLEGYFPEEYVEKFGKAFDIKSASYDFLDILEPQDLFYVDISPDECGGIVAPRIPETQYELERLLENIAIGNYVLKSVVTHEQLMKHTYDDFIK